ncbi:MAG: hypothetical protein IPI44_03860 [Sulfuritalea sp.]|nr:hypothetical protein [Sulfuritalea sp.]
MKGIMNLLARARLVELSDDERLAAEPGPDDVATLVAAPPQPPPDLPPDNCEIEQDRSFEAIFAAAGIAPASFPAEKLLRLLDGLRAMDGATRKTAVLAMDAADDNWQVADCVVDAQSKIAALEGHKRHLAAQVMGTEQQTETRIAEIKTALESATTSIRQQISELEQLLEREVTKAAQASTNLEADLRGAREAAAREARRMDGEIERLREIPAQFATPHGAT